jgi:hypothetical protein
VDVRNQGVASYETVATLLYLLTYTDCAPSLSANPLSGATGGATTFTAAVGANCVNPIFRFWMQPPGGAWRIVQDYTNGSPTFVWTGSSTPGLFRFEVDARQSNETVPYDAVALISYQVNGCTGTSITANPHSPQLPGGSVVVSGTPTCPGTPTYRFWVKAPGGSWQVKQEYSSNATFTWNTAGLAIGTYGLEIDVRDQGASSAYEATANMTYVLGQPCATPTLTANPPAPNASGQPVTLTATTTGCPNPRYRFWLKPPGGTWYTAGYITLNTYTWSAINAGTAFFEVDVRDASETTIAYDAVTTISYQFVGCASATITANLLQAPQGQVIDVRATANCPDGGNPEYRFWMKKPGGSWQIISDYPSGATEVQVPTAGLPPGTYYFEVDVRNKGTNVAYERVANIPFTLS